MKFSVCFALILFFPLIQPAVIFTGLLCGGIVCLFDWGYRFELSVYERLEQWAQSAATVTAATVERFSSDTLV